jgi:hypothetical protein
MGSQHRSIAAGGIALTSTAAIMAVGALGYLAATAATSMALDMRALIPKPKLQGVNRGYQTNARGSALDHQIIYGKVKTGGAHHL